MRSSQTLICPTAAARVIESPAESAALAKLGSQCGWTVNLAGQMRDGASAACVSVARTAKMSSTAARISDNDGCPVVRVRVRNNSRSTTSRAKQPGELQRLRGSRIGVGLEPIWLHVDRGAVQTAQQVQLGTGFG